MKTRKLFLILGGCILCISLAHPAFARRVKGEDPSLAAFYRPSQDVRMDLATLWQDYERFVERIKDILSKAQINVLEACLDSQGSPYYILEIQPAERIQGYFPGNFIIFFDTRGNPVSVGAIPSPRLADYYADVPDWMVKIIIDKFHKSGYQAKEFKKQPVFVPWLYGQEAKASFEKVLNKYPLLKYILSQEDSVGELNVSTPIKTYVTFSERLHTDSTSVYAWDLERNFILRDEHTVKADDMLTFMLRFGTHLYYTDIGVPGRNLAANEVQWMAIVQEHHPGVEGLKLDSSGAVIQQEEWEGLDLPYPGAFAYLWTQFVARYIKADMSFFSQEILDKLRLKVIDMNVFISMRYLPKDVNPQKYDSSLRMEDPVPDGYFDWLRKKKF